MAKATRATQMLESSGVEFTVHEYQYDPDADNIGMAAAAALGEPASRVLKTLMAEVDDKPVCVILPSDREVSMKKLAAVFGGKSAHMMKPAQAEKLSGYVIGGISPFGQRKRLPAVMDESPLCEPYVYMNGGRRGLQVRMTPAAALAVLGGKFANVTS